MCSQSRPPYTLLVAPWLFKLNPKVSDIPDSVSIDFQGIKLLVMGAVQTGGEGCACPENVLLKNLLSEIILNRKEAVIVDMEAGIEHLGRATVKSIDKMLICLYLEIFIAPQSS